jgi:ethanolamine utilization protein EutA (predicted chaperonin)
MFLSASIDSGIGLTAGKKLCGKAIAQSDDTYLTTVNLRQKFIQLKKFLNIKELPRLDIEKIEPLKNAINKLQSDLTEQKTITAVISEENLKMKKQFEKLQPILDFVNAFDEPEELEHFLNLWKKGLGFRLMRESFLLLTFQRRSKKLLIGLLRRQDAKRVI